MRLGVLILPDKRWRENARQWTHAEELGFDSAWTYDHIWWRGLRDDPWFSAVPVVTAAAALTRRMSVGIMVATPNFRHPVTLAKEVVALDDISEGRFVLGLGAGAPNAGDAEVLGGERLTPAERSARFHEFVTATDRLLSESAMTFDGAYYSAREARMTPGCLRAPRLPLAIAAGGRRGIDLVARHGDAWITPGPADWLGGHTPDECEAAVIAQVEQVKRACYRHGRPFEELDRILIATMMAGDPLESPDACLRMAERFARAGMTHLVIHWPRETGVYAGDVRTLEQIAAEVLPQIRDL